MDDFKYLPKHIGEWGPKLAYFTFIFTFMKFL